MLAPLACTFIFVLVAPIAFRLLVGRRALPNGEVSPQRIYEAMKRTELKTNGKGIFYNSEVSCECAPTPEGGRKISFTMTDAWGKSTAIFAANGRVKRWEIGGLIYSAESQMLREYTWRSEVFFWESVFAMMQVTEYTAGSRGEKGVHSIA